MNRIKESTPPIGILISKGNTEKVKKYEVAIRKINTACRWLFSLQVILLLSLPFIGKIMLFPFIGINISICLLAIWSNTLNRREQKVFASEIEKSRGNTETN